MVLSPLVSAMCEEQLRVLRHTRQMVVALITDYRYQLNYLDPAEGDVYELAYRTVRDGELCLQTISDLSWDLWLLYGEFDTCSRRVHHRNGTSQ